ncbi:hypothetical protein BaRGS_00036373, partial [Batillaria attramentaria]
ERRATHRQFDKIREIEGGLKFSPPETCRNTNARGRIDTDPETDRTRGTVGALFANGLNKPSWLTRDPGSIRSLRQAQNDTAKAPNKGDFGKPNSSTHLSESESAHIINGHNGVTVTQLTCSPVANQDVVVERSRSESEDETHLLKKYLNGLIGVSSSRYREPPNKLQRHTEKAMTRTVPPIRASLPAAFVCPEMAP